MLQKILIFSPLMALFLLSLVSFVFGLRNYKCRIEKQSVDPNQRSVIFTLMGTVGSAGSGSIFLFAFTLSRTVFFALFLCGILLFLIGGITLRKLVIAGKEYLVSFAIAIIGMTLLALNFPFFISMHEPFTMIYAFVIVTVICIQIVVLESWKKKRKYEIS